MHQSKPERETITWFKEQKALEDNMVKRLSTFYDSTANPLVKMMVHWIILDTMKHSEIYQALITLESGVTVSSIEKDKMTKELTVHINEETDMLKKSEEMVEQIEDKNVKELLKMIVDDENRHHQILVDLLWIVEKIDEISRAEWYKHLNSAIKTEKRIPRTGKRRSIQRSHSAR